MNDGSFAFRAHLEAALLEHFQHGDILGQDLRDQFAQTRMAGDGSEMAHQGGAYSLALVFVDDRKSHFGLSRPHDDIASAADNCRLAALFGHCHQSHMIDKVDIHEKRNLLFRKLALSSEETAI